MFNTVLSRIRFNQVIPLALFIVLLFFFISANAGPFNSNKKNMAPVFSTSTTVHKQVTSHLLHADVMADAVATNPVKAQKQVGNMIANALSNLKNGIKTTTQLYQIWKTSNSNKNQKHWHVREILSLSSTKQKMLMNAINNVASDDLVLQHMVYGISSKRKTKIHHQLLSRAIGKWQKNMKIMTQANNCHGFQIVQMETGNSFQHNPNAHVMLANQAHSSNHGHFHAPDSSKTLSLTIHGKAHGINCQINKSKKSQ